MDDYSCKLSVGFSVLVILERKEEKDMENIVTIVGEGLASLADMIVSTGSWGLFGEVTPPECLK